MLTSGQKEYLTKLSPERANQAIKIKPYDPHTRIIAANVIKIIKEKIPDADIRFMGASALAIGGQNDVDLYIVCLKALHAEYDFRLTSVFGKRIKNKWHWFVHGYEVSVYLKNLDDKKFQEQIAIFELFKNNLSVLKEYEDLKISLDGVRYQEYQIAKYEFYNRVLNIKE